MLRTAINITDTTYSCEFQYEFGNQYVSNSCQRVNFTFPFTFTVRFSVDYPHWDPF
jgi:hypothetical protein